MADLPSPPKRTAMPFETVPNAPPDPILGLNDAFRADPNPRKINLSVGVYKDATGRTPIMRCVKQAEQRILGVETTKDYVSIQGSPEYARCVQELVFGAGSPALMGGRTVTVQTPGGNRRPPRRRRLLEKNVSDRVGLAQRSDLAEPPRDFSGRRPERADVSLFRRDY